MPQNALLFNVASNSGKGVPLAANSAGVQTTNPAATNRTYNVSAPTVILTGKGTLNGITAITTGSTAGAVYDNAATGGTNTAANQIGVIPDAINGSLIFNWPVTTGIVVVPGTGQTVAVAFTPG